MNSLIKVTTSVATCQPSQVTKEVMTVCRAVTPQFYRAMTDNELKAEALSIQLLTQGIDQPTLAEMCRLAVQGYAKTRSRNAKIYFDMNYILTYYIEAFNNVHCYSVDLPKDAELISNSFDAETGKIKEAWKTSHGVVDIQFIEPKQAESKAFIQRHYTPKFYESVITNIDDIEW